MKYVAMRQRKDKLIPVRPRPRHRGDKEPGTAFDAWLQRGLHALFDDVTREPIPEELLRLIEDDRRKGHPGAPASDDAAEKKRLEKRGKRRAADGPKK
jgi:hypothetical protein